MAKRLENNNGGWEMVEVEGGRRDRMISGKHKNTIARNRLSRLVTASGRRKRQDELENGLERLGYGG